MPSSLYIFAAGLLGWKDPWSDAVDTPQAPGHPALSLAKNPTSAPQVASAQKYGALRRLALPRLLFIVLFVAFALILLRPAPVRAAGLDLPPAAKQGLDTLYSGDTDRAISAFRQIESADPESPLGYLLEADARWWQIYCEACEIKWNTIDAWQRPRIAADDAYLALADKGTTLAESRIAQRDTAEMELYAGTGLLLRARLMGLRNDRRGTARAAVAARAHLQKCLELDPQMSDAYTGLGLYNYYVDTLSAIAKIMRFFMGIPGGEKQDGIRQLRIAMEQGSLTRVEARFALAKNLRDYDRDYAASLVLFSPLVAEYPRNAIFQLLNGDVHAKLGHAAPAAASYKTAAQTPVSNPACASRIRDLAAQAASLLPAR